MVVSESGSVMDGSLARGRLTAKAALLEAAGRVFSERGYAEATSKEICMLAGTNTAAVNYYFGGKENLYKEVLIEAHRQMCDLETLDKLIDSRLPPEEKLRKFLKEILATASSSSRLWGIRIFLREMASPSAFAVQNLQSAGLPKMLKLRTLMQELTGFPADSKKLQLASGFVLVPCISYLLFPQVLRSFLLHDSEMDADTFVEEQAAYILGGIRALADHDVYVSDMTQQARS